jgi:hypothetical protein
MMHDQIISGYCTTLIKLRSIAYMRRIKTTKMAKLLPLISPYAIRRATSNRIPLCRGPCGGALTMVKHNSDPLI